MTLQIQNEESGDNENQMELRAFKSWKKSSTPNGKTQTRDMNRHFTHTESKILIIQNIRKKYLTF